MLLVLNIVLVIFYYTGNCHSSKDTELLGNVIQVYSKDSETIIKHKDLR